jgi:NAD(P)-dependent dehydrogenase (short-subunit alcohol dehydrogenase family)
MSTAVACGNGSKASTLDLPPEARGEAPGRGRMVGRRVLVIGAGQTDYHMEDQPIGNGRAISLLLAREQAKVVATDYDKSAVDGTVELITAGGGEARAIIADVRNPSEVDRTVERARDWLGGLDGVVYNVGITGPVGFADTTPDAWDNTFNVNLRGAMLTARRPARDGTGLGFRLHLIDRRAHTARSADLLFGVQSGHGRADERRRLRR